MNSERSSLGEEEDVVVYFLITPIQTVEHRSVDLFVIVDELGRSK